MTRAAGKKAKKTGKARRPFDAPGVYLPDFEKHRHEPDWDRVCAACGATPTHPLTGLCGPCTFGEAETVGGNW